MKYTCEIEIDLPRSRVVELFDNQDNHKEWVPGLVSFTTVEGITGQTGARSEIVQQMGRQQIRMVETIEKRDLPDEYTGVYTAKGVWNRVENHLSETPSGGTHWRVETEFRCSGFLGIVAFLMPGSFRKQTMIYMQAFKRFAEAAGA